MSEVKLPATIDDEDFPSAHGERVIAGGTVEDLRQIRRLEDAAANEPFNPRLPYELALEMAAPMETFAKFGVDELAAVKLLKTASFIAKVKQYRDEIVAGGVSFKLKAKVQAEDLLTHSYEMATDPEVPPAVRADLIKWTAKVANLEPKDKGEGAGAGAGFTLNISFGGGPAPTVAVTTERPAIDVTPERV